MRLGLVAAVLAVAFALPACAADFSKWEAVVVAGDFRAHSGAPTEVFDNARRDLTNAFVSIGFNPSHIRQFSVQPELYPDTKPQYADADLITQSLRELSLVGNEGCLLYFTSHGSEYGLMLADKLLTANRVQEMLNASCGKRPTILIFSACYSGVYIPPLRAANRMIFTAARPDRTSFGCGEDYKYTYFDQCILEAMPKSPNFPDVANKAVDCVAAREEKEGMEPPSEPQLFIGKDIAPLLAQKFPNR